MDSAQFTALLQVLGRIADALENQNALLKMHTDEVNKLHSTLAMISCNEEGDPYLQAISTDLGAIGLHLAGIQNAASELNTHPGFEAIQNIASTLDSIRRVGLPVEQG